MKILLGTLKTVWKMIQTMWIHILFHPLTMTVILVCVLLALGLPQAIIAKGMYLLGMALCAFVVVFMLTFF